MGSNLELAARTDLALWGSAVSLRDIETLCQTARDLKVRAVCVPGSRVELAVARLEESPIKTVALIDFPFGTADGDVKRFDAETAFDHGAQEVELVLNAGMLKDGDHRGVLRELRDVAESADERPVTVVLETELLSHEEIISATHLILDSGATAVCAGSGFVPAKADPVEMVKLIRQAAGPRFDIKCGGVSEHSLALALLPGGANRLGTSPGLHAFLTHSF